MSSPPRSSGLRRRLVPVAVAGAAVLALPAVAAMSTTASASGTTHVTAGVSTSPQPASNADFSGNGANQHGAYDSTRSGAPSLNGSGTGQASGKPCAGCVGRADNKNPLGQSPTGVNGAAALAGADRNAGYECDRNQGIGQTNPAHTGCVTPSSGPSEQTTSPPPPRPHVTASPPAVRGTAQAVAPAAVHVPQAPPPAAPAQVQAQRQAQLPVAVPHPAAAPSAKQLPFTGAETALIALTGGLVLLLGVAALWLGRRRTRQL